MSQHELEKWANTFDVLGNPIRLAIIVVVYGSDLLFEEQHSLTFGQIKSVVEVPSKQAMASHLKKLVNSGLITKHAKKDEKNRVYPLYTLTEKGKEFLTDFGLKDFIEKYIQSLNPK